MTKVKSKGKSKGKGNGKGKGKGSKTRQTLIKSFMQVKAVSANFVTPSVDNEVIVIDDPDDDASEKTNSNNDNIVGEGDSGQVVVPLYHYY